MTDEEHLAKAGIVDTPPEAPISAEAAPTGSPELPASTGAAAASNPTPVAKSAAQKAVEMFEFQGNKFPVTSKFKLNHGGKIIEVDYEKLANTYRQAVHLEDKYKKFGEEQKTFQQSKAQADAAIAFQQKYGGLQDWSEKNPKDWQTIWDLYQNRQKHLLNAQTSQGSQGTNAAMMGTSQAGNANLQPLVEKLAEMEQKFEERFGKHDQTIQNYQQREQQAVERQDTEFVKKEIGEFQTQYPEINLQERDPDGVALWAKIIQWGLQHRYTDFAPAAEMYLRQRVHDVIASRARSEALKGLKSQNVQGIVKRSTTPFNTGGKEFATPENIRKLSYGQIANMAKEQLASMG